MGNVQQIASTAEFDTQIQSGIVLVDFFATWCGPCKMQLPILEEVAAAVGEKAKVIKVNVDDLQDVAAKYNVSSIPTLIVFANGKMLDRLVGLQQAATLQNTLTNAAHNG